jgi:hypothetical protein
VVLRCREYFVTLEEGRKKRMRKLHINELHNSYSFTNTFRVSKLRMVKRMRHITPWKGRKAYEVLTGNSQGKRLLVGHGHR